MRNAAVRSNLLVPEIREVMDIRQASNYLGISAALKTPEIIELTDELPQTATGKVLRRQVRDDLLAKYGS